MDFLVDVHIPIEKIDIEFDNMDLITYITFNLSEIELSSEYRTTLIKAIAQILEREKIVLGINKSLFSQELEPNKKYVLAEGLVPVDGNDSIIKMYKIQEPVPEVQENDKVDFYELKLINRVTPNEWLGERIEATKGVNGKTVRGYELKAMDGKTHPLFYDVNTVYESYEGNKTILYSRSGGAVNYNDGKITVSNHLNIDGNVDFRTGNIHTDGFLTIKGTVEDGFSVTATKDIEVNSPLGLGNIKCIESTQGCVYIKGGICSKRKSEIKAAKNVFLKYADNVSITAGEIVNIGFYSFNSEISAKEIIIESSNGQIMGGFTRASIKISSAIIGSDSERRTVLEVLGFDRDSLSRELDFIINRFGELKNEQQLLKNSLSILGNNQANMNPFQKKDYNEKFERLFAIRDEAREMDERRKNITAYLKAKGSGEISASKKFFPNVQINIRRIIQEINNVTPQGTFCWIDGEIKFI